MQRNMDTFRDETTFEVTVPSDGDGKSIVSTSGISSPQIVVETNNTNNTLSWGINECSSSFQSVSSCETLESYEPVNTESPNVIVVPFLADNQVTGTMIANNGVHIPLIKECSIRIDPLKMTSGDADGISVERIIELPFSTDTTSEIYTTPSSLVHSDDDSPFLGFEVESTNGELCELYRKAVRLITENAARAVRDQSEYTSEPIAIDSSEPTLTERILTERHFVERQTSERKTKPAIVKRPRQIQRKNVKQRLSDDQNRSRTEAVVNAGENESSSQCKQNNVTKPVVPTSDRISFLPAQNVDERNNEACSVSDSSGSDSDVIATSVTPAVTPDNSATRKSQERSADIKNNNKEKELKKMEKMRRKKELSWLAERIQEHWMERFAAIRRKIRRKEAKKRKQENSRSKYAKNQRHRKGKRVSYSSDTDSTDSSSSSRTSGSSSSSDSGDSNDSDRDTYTSDTSYTSQTSHTSHTKSGSDSSDSDSSDQRHRHRRRLNKRRRSPSESSDTSDTSSSDDDGDNEPGRYVKQRNVKHSVKRPHSRSSASCDEYYASSRKKKSESRRSEEYPHTKQRKMRKSLDGEDDESRRMENRTVFKQHHAQRQHRFDYPSTSAAAAAANVKKNHKFESTSAGDFFVK